METYNIKVASYHDTDIIRKILFFGSAHGHLNGNVFQNIRPWGAPTGGRCYSNFRYFTKLTLL